MPLDTIILEKGYPAYTYKVEDEVKTLNELQLTPSALLIVKYHSVSHSFQCVYHMTDLSVFLHTERIKSFPLTVQDISVACTVICANSKSTATIVRCCVWVIQQFHAKSTSYQVVWSHHKTM